MEINLKVNEIFGPTIQGEGRSAGHPVMFLRLALCNLHCIWCDTPYTWNWKGTSFQHPDKYDPSEEIHEKEVMDVINALYEKAGDVRSLVISGGEPLIQHKQLIPVLRLLKFEKWWIEVETNATISPPDNFAELVNQFNCSPKLSNSGDPLRLRERSEAMHFFANHPDAYFKFVVQSEQDIAEIQKLVEKYRIPYGHVYLMPLGKTIDELNLTRAITQNICNQYGFLFSDRLHVVQFGGIRAV